MENFRRICKEKHQGYSLYNIHFLFFIIYKVKTIVYKEKGRFSIWVTPLEKTILAKK